MKYTKPALSFERQAELLIGRGLIVQNKEELITHLKMVNYYRLSAYWFPFKNTDPINGSEKFKSNTTFEKIWNLYSFDRQLRLLIMDAIEQTVTAGGSSLSYDAVTDQYTYVWKTDKAWSNTCRTLVLKLSDGSYYRANFKFKK